MTDVSVGASLNAYDGTNLGADRATGPEVARSAPGKEASVEELIAAAGGPAAIAGQLIGEGLPAVLMGSPFGATVDMAGPGEST